MHELTDTAYVDAAGDRGGEQALCMQAHIRYQNPVLTQLGSYDGVS